MRRAAFNAAVLDTDVVRLKTVTDRVEITLD